MEALGVEPGTPVKYVNLNRITREQSSIPEITANC